ncbi:MAG: CHASE2 domain-containing protein [Acidobacteriia bacterium]|nr:CHASE2 domain-containing protein [Terriglobia bacterium]
MAASRKNAAQYVGLLAAAFGAGVCLSYFLGGQLDNYAYDFMFRVHPPKSWKTQSVILAIDDKTLRSCGGMENIREPLARGLKAIASVPKVVVVDLLLADSKPAVDGELADAFRRTSNLVLASQIADAGWEDPRPEFSKGAAIGHVYAQPDADNVTRAIPLEKSSGRVRRWAISLEAFRLSRGGATPVEDPDYLNIGGAVIPVPASEDGRSLGSNGRLMRVRFAPPGMPPIPRVSLADLLEKPTLVTEFTGKVVFVGVTSLSLSDRLSTPVSFATQTPGVEVHASAFETMAQGLFITDIPHSTKWVFVFSLGIAAAIGLSFRYLPGWQAYAGGGLTLLGANLTPYLFFTHGRVFSFSTPFFAAWLGFVSAAAFYHLVVRRNWRTEQAARARYQQAMHFVTHEMRTPLSAIQGSSEIISRYALPEEKRKQIALLINSESKRLARMVEIFLNVERLSAGQMELKRETIPVKELIDICVERTRPLAERKRIGITVERMADELQVTGDRELMEYACYNLLTNAVKYSPQQTEVAVSGWKGEGQVRIAVKDQGIGIDQKEVKQIFQKFYRTRKAEESGEAGTGIGLSIVQQIVEQHGGRIEVTSQPGVGSCFTLALPEAAAAERN